MKRFYVIICAFFLFALQTAHAQKAPEAQGEPVIIKNDTLFKFYVGQGLFTPKERARAITRRIESLIDRFDFNPDSLILRNDTAVSIIFYQSHIVLAINNKDAAFSELSRPELAASYLDILKKKLGDVFANNSVKQTITNILEVIAVIVMLVLFIWGVNRAFKLIKLKTANAWEKRVAKLAKQGAPVSYASKLYPFLNSLLTVIRLIIIILLIYLALPILFFIFPASKPIATLLLGYVVGPL